MLPILYYLQKHTTIYRFCIIYILYFIQYIIFFRFESKEIMAN